VTMGCAGSRKEKFDKYLVPKGTTVKIIVSPEFWEPYEPKPTEDGGMEEKRDPRDCATELAYAKDELAKMRTQRSSLFMTQPGSELETRQNQFLGDQARLVGRLWNMQNEDTAEGPAGGQVMEKGTLPRMWAGKLFRTAVIMNTFRSSEGDSYTVRYLPTSGSGEFLKESPAAPSEEETRGAEPADGKPNETDEAKPKKTVYKEGDKLVSLEDLVVAADGSVRVKGVKAPRASIFAAPEFETGVPRGRIIFDEFCQWTKIQVEQFKADSNQSFMAHPTAAQVWGADHKLTKGSLEVAMQNFEFKKDQRGPTNGNFCWGRKYKYHCYKLNGGKDGGLKGGKTLYFYEPQD